MLARMLLATFAVTLAATDSQAADTNSRKPAQAATGYQCTDRAGGPDNGYLVYVSSKRTRADIQEQSIAGPHTIATLVCKPPTGNGHHGGADRITVVLSCSEPNIRDGGYSLDIEAGGLAGLTTATLSEVTIAGANPVAQLNCKAAQ